MPFDPSLPATNSPNSSAEMRSQLTSLKALIDAILTITAAQVDGVNTLNPGDPANASVSVVGNTLHFTFGIPRGNDGAQGPPFAQAIVDAVNTLNPGDAASVSVSFDVSNVRFTFGIPRGQDGVSSPPITSFIVDGVNTLNPGDNATVQTSFDGANVRFLFGIPRGNDGMPGEVTNAQLSSAISGTSNNTNAVSTLDTPFANDPPTLADMETMRAKFNELVLAARR